MQAVTFNAFTDAFGTAVAHYANVSSARMNQRRLDLAEQGQEFEMALKTRQQAQQEQRQAFEIQTRFMDETRKQQQFDAEMPVYLTQLSLKQMELEEAKKEAMYSFKASDYKRNGANSEIGRTLHSPAGAPAGASAVEAVAKTTGTTGAAARGSGTFTSRDGRVVGLMDDIRGVEDAAEYERRTGERAAWDDGATEGNAPAGNAFVGGDIVGGGARDVEDAAEYARRSGERKWWDPLTSAAVREAVRKNQAIGLNRLTSRGRDNERRGIATELDMSGVMK